MNIARSSWLCSVFAYVNDGGKKEHTWTFNLFVVRSLLSSRNLSTCHKKQRDLNQIVWKTVFD